MSAYAFSLFSPLPPVVESTLTSHKSDLGLEGPICETSGVIEKTTLNISIQTAQLDTAVLLHSVNKKETQSDDLISGVSNDAFRFQLFINFNGRKYTASRTFSKFSNLRKGLLKELIQTKILPRRNSVNRGRFSCVTQEQRELIEMKIETLLPKLPNSVSSNSLCSKSTRSQRIVPSSFPGSCGSGNNFTAIQTLLDYYYCPMLENWLKDVLDVIDADMSQSLNTFLWEPLRDDETETSRTCSILSESSNFTNLSSIYECEDTDDMDEDTDDMDEDMDELDIYHCMC